MTYRDPEDILRQALHSAAESIEPSADGLGQIRARLNPPRPLVIAWLTAGWEDLGHLMMFRLVPALAAVAGWLGRLLHPVIEPLRPAFRWLPPVLEWLRPAADMVGAWAERLGRPAARPGESGRSSRYGWLRPAIAMAAVILVAVAGGFALSGMRNPISQVAASLLPSQANTTGGGGHGTKAAGHGQPIPGSNGDKARPTPSTSCSPSGKHRGASTRKAKSTPTPTASPSVSPSPSPSVSPSPSPSVSPSPSPSDSGGSGDSDATPAADQGGNVTTSMVVMSASPSPACTPSPTPTTSGGG
jgi:hypothetical protein